MSSSKASTNIKTFKQKEIEYLLKKLGFNFKTTGMIEGNLAFTSLRAPRPAGIYFLASGISLPDSISGSLILSDLVPDNLISDNVYVVLANPQLAFYKLMRSCFEMEKDAGIHVSALIDPQAVISETAYIGPFCVIEPGVSIERDCYLDSHVVVKSGSSIDSGVVIESHCTIGATGVAWVWDEGDKERIVQPQIGGVRIGKDVFIGSDVSVVRGSVNEITEIGDFTVIAHGSKIGHGCILGKYNHLANNITLGGNVFTGEKVFFGSGAVVRPRISISRGVVVGAGAVVISDIKENNIVVGGVPAKKIKISGRVLSGVPTSQNK